MSSLIVDVCRIDEIEKHPNADKLDIALIKGWNCIVQRDQYKVGDLVVFFPPDSVIPESLIDKYNLEFLRNGGRVGSIRLRGAISQGLVLGMDCLPPKGYYEVGENVAKVLGIEKYNPPERVVNGQANPISKKKLNPNLDRYTDIENIKNYNEVFSEDDDVVILEKVHGSNARFGNLEIVVSKQQPLMYRLKAMFRKYILRQTHEFVYGSHNVQLHGDKNNYYGTDLWGRIAKKYDLVNKIPKDMIIYGEVYGKGVQDLVYGLTDIDLVIFDVKYRGRYMSWNVVTFIANKLGINTVPVLYEGKFNKDILVSCTDGKSILAPAQIREGCVVKMYEEGNDRRLGRKILKSVSIDYLTRKNPTEYH